MDIGKIIYLLGAYVLPIAWLGFLAATLPAHLYLINVGAFLLFYCIVWCVLEKRK